MARLPRTLPFPSPEVRTAAFIKPDSKLARRPQLKIMNRAGPFAFTTSSSYRGLRSFLDSLPPKLRSQVCLSSAQSKIIAQSPNGFDDACREAIAEASKTLRGIRSFWIKNAECVVENDQITIYRVNGKISFLVEADRK
jgi:dodecin